MDLIEIDGGFVEVFFMDMIDDEVFINLIFVEEDESESNVVVEKIVIENVKKSRMFCERNDFELSIDNIRL